MRKLSDSLNLSSLKIYVDGKILAEEDAKVSVYDRSFIYGDGIFEGLAVFDDKILQLDEHLKRLVASANYFRIQVPMKESEMRDAVLRTLEANKGLKVSYMRIILTRGVGPLGIDRITEVANPTFVIIPAIRKKFLGLGSDNGIKANIASVRRNSPQCLDPAAKSTGGYANITLAKLESIAAGADEAVMLDLNGLVAESCTENIFVVKDDKIWTPRSANILEGITRATIIQLAQRKGYYVEERDITPYDLFNADEVFLTGSLAGTVPVIQIDGKSIGDGKPGIITKGLKEEWIRSFGTPIASLTSFEGLSARVKV